MGEVVAIKPEPEYHFEGRRIKLTALDYETWKRRFHGIPDFDSELWAMDSWYAGHLAPNEKWYFRLERHLTNRHQQWLSKRSQDHPTAEKARKFTGVANTMPVKCTPEELQAYNTQFHCQADEVPSWWLAQHRRRREGAT